MRFPAKIERPCHLSAGLIVELDLGTEFDSCQTRTNFCLSRQAHPLNFISIEILTHGGCIKIFKNNVKHLPAAAAATISLLPLILSPSDPSQFAVLIGPEKGLFFAASSRDLNMFPTENEQVNLTVLEAPYIYKLCHLEQHIKSKNRLKEHDLAYPRWRGSGVEDSHVGKE